MTITLPPAAERAVYAVAELHRPVDGGLIGTVCRTCADEEGARPWPCATWRALADELPAHVLDHATGGAPCPAAG